MKTRLHRNILGTAVLLAASSAFALSDAEIAKIVSTANNVEIAESELAQSKSDNKDVKAFAEEMVKIHKDNNKESSDVAKKNKIEPAANDSAKNMEQESTQQKTSMKKLSGAEFNKAYVDREISLHTKLLQSIDSELLPNAKNPDLKALLEKTRPIVQQHLDHAKHLQALLDNTSKKTK